MVLGDTREYVVVSDALRVGMMTSCGMRWRVVTCGYVFWRAEAYMRGVFEGLGKDWNFINVA